MASTIRIIHVIGWALVLVAMPGCQTMQSRVKFDTLFPDDGIPKGWIVRSWANVKDAPPAGASWKAQNGILQGGNPRGTWLVSEREYGDFVIDFEWKLGERGNSGFGFRFPLEGDPAYDGLEIQMVDQRYYGNEPAPPDTLTGSVYKALAPTTQVYKPLEWNKYRVTCKGSRIKVVLNGKKIIDVNLDEQTKPLERGQPLRDRPRRGRIGFRELSRSGGNVEIRNAKIGLLE